MNTFWDEFFASYTPFMAALLASSFTWGMTALGAGLVFLVKDIKRRFLDTMLGFTGGVMVAASFWSLLAPAIDLSEGEGLMKVVPALVGFLTGALFLFALDKMIPHLHIHHKLEEAEGPKTDFHGTILLVFAITLHNIPEGLAVGVLMGGAYLGLEGTSFAQAAALAIGIGIQNFPEGLAVSMPLRRMGLSRMRSFLYGQASAVVEPMAAVAGALLVVQMAPILPYALAFAAGAMMYVVVEEVIPETQKDVHQDSATLGFMLGFAVMMTLDVGFAA